MEKKVFAFVVVDHTTRLRFHRDPSLSFNIQLIQNLFVASSGFNGARELQQPVREG